MGHALIMKVLGFVDVMLSEKGKKCRALIVRVICGMCALTVSACGWYLKCF